MKKIVAMVKKVDNLLLVAFSTKQDPETATRVSELLKTEYGEETVVKFTHPKNLKGSFQIRTFNLEG